MNVQIEEEAFEDHSHYTHFNLVFGFFKRNIMLHSLTFLLFLSIDDRAMTSSSHSAPLQSDFSTLHAFFPSRGQPNMICQTLNNNNNNNNKI